MSKKRKVITWFLRVAVIIVLFIAAYMVVSLPTFLVNRTVGEYYSANIFPFISYWLNTVSNFFYFSLTEMVVVVGSVFLVVFLIHYIRIFVRNIKHNGINSAMVSFLKFFKNVASIVLVGAIVFELMHGLNYRRTSPITKLQLGRNEHTYEEYCEALEWAYNGMVYSRNQLGSDYNGVAHFTTNFETSVTEANGLLDAFSNEYGLNMSHNFIRAKSVMLSRAWRYTDIVGAYDMFLGEANISTDYMDIIDTPITICHEIAHAKGYASETDCNVIASLACIHSGRDDFRYAGFCYIYFDIRSKVIDIANNLDYELPDTVHYPREVYLDIMASRQYDDIFSNPFGEVISEVSDNVNNSFLEANGQEGGVETYKVPMDIYVDFYFKYVGNDV